MKIRTPITDASIRMPDSGNRRRSPAVVRRLLSAMFAGILAFAASGAHAEPGSGPREYRLKAAFIFNFIKFVEWQAQDLPSTTPNLRVCVAGREAYAAALETINGKSAKGKTVIVTQFSGPQDLAGCQVLFISAAERQRSKGALDAARNSGILTVGEMDDFARNGGVINFTEESNRVRFEINPQAAERAHLTISSQLLKLAKVIKA